MTLNEYQTLAARTIATDDKAEMESHALYGLTAEIGELMDSCFGTDVDHTIKECGDVCWMIAELCTVHEWFLGDVLYPEHWTFKIGQMTNCMDIAIANGLINGTYQKVLQGHRWDDAMVRFAIDEIFARISAIANLCGTDLDCVLQTNIDKLKARYPMGFSTERSLNRRDDDI